MLLLIGQDQEQEEKFLTLFDFIEYDTVITANSNDWEKKLNEHDEIDVIMLAHLQDTREKLEICNQIKKRRQDIPVLVINGDESEEALKQLEENAFVVLGAPLRYNQLCDGLRRAKIFHVTQLKHNNELFRSLVGTSKQIREVVDLKQQVAGSDATVLILGESGTGKEVVARNLHYYSSRRGKPFVPINCGAIPADLMESELFGHEKGAFTGAFTTRQGRFEMAQGGTIFLDEIGDMPLNMQVKLLRVLQERCFERVGSTTTIPSDVRVVAATHRNLEDLINKGKFREDLYYRLNVFPIEMPALRERVEDIPLLVNELISRLEHEKRGSVRLTPKAVLALCEHRWPGNVRELANLIERLMIMNPYGVVDVNDLPAKYKPEENGTEVGQEEKVDPIASVIENIKQMSSQDADPAKLPAQGLDLKEHITSIESSLIEQALDEAGGIVARAAVLLKMRRTTLVEKMRKYDLQRSAAAS
jgi:sigma-54 specific flagellar transcriptional regulator A